MPAVRGGRGARDPRLRFQRRGNGDRTETPSRWATLGGRCSAHCWPAPWPFSPSPRASIATAAPPTGFTPPQTLGAGLQVSGAIVAADAAGGQPAAVAFADRSGRVWAARVRADGSLGSPLPAGSGQIDVRDAQVAVTDRGELVVVWAALVNRSNGGSAVRYAVAAPGRSFAGARTLAAVGSNTGATPRMAALRGGTVAVIFRDTRPPRAGGVLRYARRAPHGSFGTARSLGRDGVGPEIQASPGGGALLAWGQGPLTRRALVVASAQRGAPLPGPATSVAGSVRSITLTASADGTAWVDLDAARQQRDDRLRPAHPREQPLRRRSRAIARDGGLRRPARRARRVRQRARHVERARPGRGGERRARRPRRAAGRASARRASSTRAASARPRRPPRGCGRRRWSSSRARSPAPRACRPRRWPPTRRRATPRCSPTRGATPRPRSRTAAPALVVAWAASGRRHRGQPRSLIAPARPTRRARHAASMNDTQQQRSALVFGARNLGRGVIENLRADGWAVAAVARSESTLATARGGGRPGHAGRHHRSRQHPRGPDQDGRGPRRRRPRRQRRVGLRRHAQRPLRRRPTGRGRARPRSTTGRRRPGARPSPSSRRPRASPSSKAAPRR